MLLSRSLRMFSVAAMPLLLLLSIAAGSRSPAELKALHIPRGLLMCSGADSLFLEAVTMIEQLRSHNSSSMLPIVVSHCAELGAKSTAILQSIEAVHVMNICGKQALKGSFFQEKRARGFFCKAISLVLSPFQETLLVDSDVIWFRRPELLFDSPRYVQTGALFMRDRLTVTRNKLTLTGGEGSLRAVLSYIKKLKARIDAFKAALPESSASQQRIVNDIYSGGNWDGKSFRNFSELAAHNSFWQPAAGGTVLDHCQDSSALLLNARSHPHTLLLLKLMVSDFSLGYGDKEIYWLAATVAGEAFAFEPYAAGSLGDCGAIVHFDPRSEGVAGGRRVEPFYVNAEYLVDLSKVSRAGQFIASADSDGGAVATLLSAQVSAPLYISPDAEQSTRVTVLRDWRNMPHGFYPCGSCRGGCAPAAQPLLQEVLLRQRFLLELKNVSSKEELGLEGYRRAKEKAYGQFVHSP